MKLQCRKCGKKWYGSTLIDCEIASEINPCKCAIEASKLSDEELVDRLIKSGGAGSLTREQLLKGLQK